MPWLALIFEQRQIKVKIYFSIIITEFFFLYIFFKFTKKAEIWQKFDVTHTPTVGLLDADTGAIVHKNIATQINADPDLTLFSLKR